MIHVDTYITCDGCNPQGDGNLIGDWGTFRCSQGTIQPHLEAVRAGWALLPDGESHRCPKCLAKLPRGHKWRRLQRKPKGKP